MAKKYDESNIQRHAGILGLRKRPTMYMGATDSTGLWTIIREVLDNVCDLTTKGLIKGTGMGHLIFDPNKKGFWVLDNGPGFPVGTQTYLDEKGNKEKLSAFYVATGLTHGGSNFDSDSNSRGVNGIGIKIGNAMSSSLKIWTWRDGSCYSIQYKDARLSKNVAKDKAPKLPFGVKFKSGSAVYIEPDMSLFSKGSKLDPAMIVEWCTLTSVLVPNISFNVTDIKGKTVTYKPTKITDYLETRLKECNATAFGKPFSHHGKNIDIALYFANAENNEFRSYTNGLHNIDGGEHVKIVQDAIAKSIKPYATKKDDYKPADLYEGIVGVVNAKMAAPQFNVQTKDRLIDARLKPAVGDEVYQAFVAFWSKNKQLAKDVIKRAATLRKKTNDFLADKQLIKKVKGASKGMSDKFSDVNSSKTPVDQRELYIVEGDSAGGTAKKARDKAFQATFAIRGKPLNVLDATKEKITNNKEVAGILAGIGVGSDSKNVHAIRFGKIVFLADPDVDGYHINCLLLGLFWHFTPHLFEEGKIFMLKSPEYIAEFKGKNYYGMTPDDIYKQVDTKKLDIEHIKGWGELTPDQMSPIAFDLGKRQLIRVLPPKSNNGKLNFEALISGKGNYRKVLLGLIDEEDVEKAAKNAPAKKKAEPVKKAANSNKKSSAKKTAKKKKAA